MCIKYEENMRMVLFELIVAALQRHGEASVCCALEPAEYLCA